MRFAPPGPIGRGRRTLSSAWSASTFTFLNRDAGSKSGQAQCAALGSGFSGAVPVTVGGQNATGIVVLSPTIIAFNVPVYAGTPPVDGTAVDVVIGGITGSSQFTYYPDATTTFVPNTTAEDGTHGAWGFLQSNANFTDTDSVAFAQAGTHSRLLRRTTGVGINNAGGARLNFDFGANAPLNEANGVYVHWYIYVPAATLTALTQSLAQIKLALFRQTSGAQPGYLVPGIGSAFPVGGANTLHGNIDPSVSNLPDSGVDLRDTWTEIVYWVSRKGGVGYARIWVNGKLWVNITDAAMGVDSATAYQIEIGIAWSESGSGQNPDYLVYVDNASVKNGFIDP